MSLINRQEDYPNQIYAWYVVGVLTVAYIFSFVDRQIINLLVEPIQQDLQLTDTQISLLQGIAFALFYTLMGIPIARLADVSNRRAIIAAGGVPLEPDDRAVRTGKIFRAVVCRAHRGGNRGGRAVAACFFAVY